MSTTIKLKVIIDGEMRKFKFCKKSQAYDDFLSKIYQLWKKKFSETDPKVYATLLTKYLDSDNDWISFSTEEEWKELLDDMSDKDTIKISVEAPKKSAQDQWKEGEKKVEDFISNLLSSGQVKDLMKQFGLNKSGFGCGKTKGSNPFQNQNPFTSFCKTGPSSMKCGSFDELMKNLFSSLNPEGNCKKSSTKCSSSGTTEQKQKEEKKPSTNAENIKKTAPKRRQQTGISPSFTKVDKKEEKKPLNSEEKVKNESKNDAQPNLGNGQDFGQMLQQFIPGISNAFQQFQKGGQNQGFGNLFSGGSSEQKPKEKRDFSKEMETLKNMGFMDEELNLTYLEKWGGNIKRVVAEYFK